MKRYAVKFKCLLPVKIDTVLEAVDENDLIRKLENRDIGEFHYKTIGDFQYVQDVFFEELDKDEQV